MNGDELIAKLLELSPEQRKLPVCYVYYVWHDELEKEVVGDINKVAVGDDSIIRLED